MHLLQRIQIYYNVNVNGIRAKGVKLESDWLHYQGYPNTYIGPAILSLNNTKLLLPNNNNDNANNKKYVPIYGQGHGINQ